jgi:LysM repeat protein
MARPTCHYCTEGAEKECPTCGRLYCGEHGEDVCLRCLSPEAAAPSALIYRGALLALAIGTLVTVFLLISPPESASSGDTVRNVATATPAVSTTATPTPRGTPGATTTATASASPSDTATAAPGAPQQYIVQSGDSLFGIADQFGITTEALEAANPGFDFTNLQPGDVINIPAAQ